MGKFLKSENFEFFELELEFFNFTKMKKLAKRHRVLFHFWSKCSHLRRNRGGLERKETKKFECYRRSA